MANSNFSLTSGGPADLGQSVCPSTCGATCRGARHCKQFGRVVRDSGWSTRCELTLTLSAFGVVDRRGKPFTPNRQSAFVEIVSARCVDSAASGHGAKRKATLTSLRRPFQRTD